MLSRARHVAKPPGALLAALAALAATPAAGQADPFALPRDLTAQSVAQATVPMLSEVVVDGKVAPRMVTLSGNGQNLTIDADEARGAGIPVPDGASGPVKLASLSVYEWSFDPLRQRLSVKLFKTGANANLKDFAVRRTEGSESRPLLALRVDYDLTATMARGATSAGGLVSATAVYGNFGVNSSGRLSSNPELGSPHLLRLDSTARLAVPAKGMSVSLGDFVSAGSQSQRAVRMAGLQIASDFELRPDLVTVPLPGFAGNVAVPTTIDVLAGDQRYQLGEIEPGEFTVRNVPTQPGRGEASVILRDALGREVVQTARFYVTDALLAPRTTGYAVNAGFVRRRYGLVSNDYGQLAATAFVRRGLSSSLTFEASGEWTHGVANGGVRADFLVGKVALATAELRASRDSGAGTGTLLNFALESVGQKLGGSLRATLPSATYSDVATRLGDEPPPKQYAAQAFYRFNANTQIQLTYARQEFRERLGLIPRDPKSEVLNANFRSRLSSRATLFAGGGVRRTSTDTVYSAAAGLSLSLGPRTNAGAYASYDGGRVAGSATYTHDAIRDGQIGYRAAANISQGSQRVTAGVTMRDRRFYVDGQIEEVDGTFAARANARGTLLLAGGTVFARNQSGGAYALVRTGRVSGIPITRENQTIGTTDKNGLLLVQNIPAQATIKIDVDADKLPADALVRETTKLIRVPRASVALVEIETKRFLPVVRRLVDPAGNPLVIGQPVRALPSGDVSMTGFDGMVEINAGAENDRLVVGRPGATCEVALGDAKLEPGDAAPLVCHPLTIDEAAPPATIALADPSRPTTRRRGTRAITSP